MKIVLAKRYSPVDKEWQYSLITKDGIGDNNPFYHWVWFYVGKHLKRKHKRLYPYLFSWEPESKVIKEYKDCHSAEQIAKWIVKAIKR